MLPANDTPPFDNFQYAISMLDATEFEIPREQASTDEYFPDYLRQQLTRYVTYYESHLRPYFEAGQPFGSESRVVVLPMDGSSIMDKIVQLADGLCETVSLYYEGHLLGATEAFRRTLNAVDFKDLFLSSTMHPGMVFYRTRPRAGYGFTRRDLFHNPFQNRGRMATNRYSVPGLPALYVGDSAYVCWEEANQERIADLYFSRLTNVRPVRLIRIQRLPDLIAMVDGIGMHAMQLNFLAAYLALFPISIACSVRAKFSKDTFKPEYIIPQILMQYVTAEREMDGIMFPSSKVSYSRLKRVPAYNYVFPVKHVQSKGFCKELVSTFAITSPTSIELEELLSYGTQRTTRMEAFADIIAARQTVVIADGLPQPYATTSFGFIEAALAKGELRHLDEQA